MEMQVCMYVCVYGIMVIQAVRLRTRQRTISYKLFIAKTVRRQGRQPRGYQSTPAPASVLRSDDTPHKRSPAQSVGSTGNGEGHPVTSPQRQRRCRCMLGHTYVCLGG